MLKKRFVSIPQRLLYRWLHQLFYGHEVYLDHNHKELRYSDTKSPVQLDVYIPSLNLAFEYQGEQHYNQNLFSDERIRQRDEEKRQLCKHAGITLIEVPYTWNKEKDSIVELIHKQRPDIKLQSK